MGGKIKRNLKIYRYNDRKRPKKIIGFILILICLVALGFFSAKPLLGFIENLSVDKTSSINSDGTSSDVSDQVSEESSSFSSEEAQEPPINNTVEIKSIIMPKDVVFDASLQAGFIEKVKAEGYNAVVVELKDENGQILYQSTLEKAQAYGVIPPNAINLTSLLETIDGAGMTAIAKISALKDKTAAHASRGNSYLYANTKKTWLDNEASKGGKAWLNPYFTPAREYITEICKEISDIGFKTILLDDLQFPDGTMYKLNMGEETVSRTQILAQLVGEIQNVVAENKTQVIPMIKAEAFSGIKNSIYGGIPNGLATDICVIIDVEVLQENALTIQTVMEQIKSSENIICVGASSAQKELLESIIEDFSIGRFVIL